MTPAMPALPVFHLDEHWFALDGNTLHHLDAYPELDAPALVISDFGAAQDGSMALEGSAAAAAPLIEKRLRTEGVVDGETKILLSHQIRVGRGFKAIYTAVPMTDWQRLGSWSANCREHCLVVPLLAVMRRLCSTGQAVVVRNGRHLRYLHVGHNAIAYAETLSYSENADDLEAAATALGKRVADAARSGGALPGARWIAVEATSEASEAALADAFAQAAGTPAVQAPMRRLRTASGTERLSALPSLASAASAADSVSVMSQRVLFAAERALPWAAAVASVAGALLLAVGITTHLRAGERTDQAASLHAQAQQLAQQAEQMEAQLRVLGPAPVDALAFLERLAQTRGQQDVVALLRDLAGAAGGSVRILRVRFDSPDSGITLEGAADNGVAGGDQLARFVARLRQRGFEIQALEPAGGSQASGVFSYLLKRADPTHGDRS